MRRGLLTLLVVVVVAALGCSREPETTRSAPAPTVPDAGTRAGTAGTTPGTTGPDGAVDDPGSDASVVATDDQAAPPPTTVTTARTPRTTVAAPPRSTTPPPSYDPALQPWCDSLNVGVQDIVGDPNQFDIVQLPLLLGPLRASLDLAPPDMVDPTNRLIGALEKLEGAIASGEVTDRDTALRWGLVNLTPEEIVSLQDDLYIITGKLAASCPPL